MDPEFEKLLKQNIQLSKANYEMLSAMRREHRWSQTTKWLYRIIMIIVAIAVYIRVIDPLIDSIQSTRNALGLDQNSEQTENTSSGILSSFGSVLESITGSKE